MTLYCDERFERVTGYDHDGEWNESVGGAGSTVDEDADPADVSSPPGWGTQCLKIIKVANENAFTYRANGANPITYTRFEIVITAEDLGNNNIALLLYLLRNTLALGCVAIRLYQTGNNLYFSMWVNHDGTGGESFTSAIISLDTLYRFDIKWDATNDLWEILLNGASEASGALTGSHSPDAGVILCGYDTSEAYNYTAYYDRVKQQNNHWAGDDHNYVAAILKQRSFDQLRRM